MATLKNTTINDTGSLTVANGDTGARTTVNGTLRHNTSTGKTEQYTNGVWRTIDGALGSASTGGSITTSGGYRIHTFTSGSDSFVSDYTGAVEILVVAGGGGGAPIGGGAGAGGYIYNANYPVTAGTGYSTSIGTGGLGAPIIIPMMVLQEILQVSENLLLSVAAKVGFINTVQVFLL